MSRLEHQLQELTDAGVIDDATAKSIKEYLDKKVAAGPNRQLIIFSILGALLIGLGIILIIAHNWDQLSRSTKAFFAFLPLIIGQGAALFTLLKRRESIAWREGSTTFLVFAIGASIALISQIYNIPGSMAGFLLTWTLLILPLIYIMRSSTTALLFITGITWYACDVSYWTYPTDFPWWYWAQLAAVVPFYILKVQRSPDSNFTAFLHWLIPLSLVICLGTFAEGYAEFIFMAYFSLFSLLFLLGGSKLMDQKKLYFNSYRVIGSIGALILLIVFTFQDPWQDMADIRNFRWSIQELWLTVIISLVTSAYLLKRHLAKAHLPRDLTAYAFIFFIVSFGISQVSYMTAVVLTNIFVLAHGLLLVQMGSRRQQLSILNYGLLIITALIICRFFDVNISFIIRGAMFLAVGFSFFLFNYRVIKKKKLS